MNQPDRRAQGPTAAARFAMRSRRAQVAFTLAALGAYGLIFFPTYRLMGPSAVTLALLPAAIAGWLLGMRAGLLFGLVCFPLNILLLNLVGQPGWEVLTRTGGGASGTIFLILVGGAVGWVSDLGRRATRELAARQRAEEALRSTEAMFRNLVEQSLVGVYIIQEGQFAYVNPKLAEIFGYTPGEITASISVSDLVAEEDQARVAENLRARLQGEVQALHYTFRGQRRDGTPVDVEVFGARTEFRGKPAVIGTLLDVTERKRAEESLRQAEEKYRSIFENAVIGIFRTTLDGRYLEANPTQARIYGYGSPEALMEALTDLNTQFYVEPGRRAEFIRLMEARGFVEDFESQVYRKDGSVIWISENARVLRDVSGRIIGFEGTTVDITQRKQAEEAVQRAEQRYRELFEEAPVMYVITRDQEGGPAVVNCNELFLTTLGYTRAEVVGRPLAGFYTPEARAKMLEGGYQRALQGEFLSEERELAARDGRMVEVLLRAIPEVAPDGHVTGTRAMFVDITERKRAEAALEQRLRETLLLNRVIAATTSTLEPTTVLQTVCQELARAFDVPQSAAALLDADRTHLTVVAEYCAAGRPSALGAVMPVANNPAAQYVLERRLPLALTEVGTDPRMEAIRDLMKPRGTVSLLIVPLMIRDQVVGTLGLDALERREFSPQAIALAQNVAAATSTALENARLFTAAEGRLKHVQALRSIDMAITASLDLRLTLNVLLDQVAVQLRVDAANILLLGPHSQRLEYAAGRGFRTPALQHTRLGLGEGYAGHAAVEQRIIHIADLRHRHTDFLRSPLFAQEAFVTYYGVPLIAKGQVVGVLEIFHRAPLDPDSEWLDFLGALAAQAAIAIDNAALFDRLQRSNAELAVAYDATIEGWSRALDLRDKETEGHTRRVTEMTVELARAMGMSEEELVHVRRGTLLHDIGKMGIPDGILLKPGPLTDEEWVLMRRHPTLAYEMLSPITFLRLALDIPYCHHEKWDGTGYPRGLKGEQIPLAARLFAVVDVWDALRSDRPYRSGWPEEKVRQHIRQQAGTHFDSQIAEVFLTILSEA